MATRPRSNRRRRRDRGATALGLALTVVIGLTAATASAKSERTATYSYERVWPAAVRFLRIDEGHSVTEKDLEAGYVIFDLSDDGKIFRGTLELIRVEDDGRPGVRMVVHIEDRPSYMESGLLRRLLAKLRNELGAPDRSRPAPPPKPAPPAKPTPPPAADDEPATDTE